MRFEGKVSQWWYGVTVFLNVFAVAALVFWHMNGAAMKLFIPPWILLDLYLIPVILRNYVTVDKLDVTIRFGFFRKSVLTQNITELKLTKSMASSFAASSDRVAIDVKGYQTIYVSVIDNKAFIKELQRLNRKIKYTIG